MRFLLRHPIPRRAPRGEAGERGGEFVNGGGNRTLSRRMRPEELISRRIPSNHVCVGFARECGRHYSPCVRLGPPTRHALAAKTAKFYGPMEYCDESGILWQNLSYILSRLRINARSKRI